MQTARRAILVGPLGPLPDASIPAQVEAAVGENVAAAPPEILARLLRPVRVLPQDARERVWSEFATEFALDSAIDVVVRRLSPFTCPPPASAVESGCSRV